MLARCVCFDLGGTLVRINHTWEAAMAQAGVEGASGREYGLITGFAPLAELHSEATTESAYYAELAEWLGVSILDAERIHHAILRDPYPGSLDLVKEIQGKGWKTGGLSNTNLGHMNEMTRTGRFLVVEALDPMVTSYEVGYNKPDPRIYKAFEDASACEGQEIVFFDDNGQNVQAAASLGWCAHLVDPEHSPVAQMRAVLTPML